VLGFAQQEGKRRDGIPCGYSSQGPTKTGGGRRRAGGVRLVVATREKTHERYERERAKQVRWKFGSWNWARLVQ
jgi:hypothetical protein